MKPCIPKQAANSASQVELCSMELVSWLVSTYMIGLISRNKISERLERSVHSAVRIVIKLFGDGLAIVNRLSEATSPLCVHFIYLAQITVKLTGVTILPFLFSRTFRDFSIHRRNHSGGTARSERVMRRPILGRGPAVSTVRIPYV
jgi:hypothetical protein